LTLGPRLGCLAFPGAARTAVLAAHVVLDRIGAVRRFAVVLHVEDCFALLRKVGCEDRTLVVLQAGLVDAEVVVLGEGRDNGHGVFQGNGHPEGVRVFRLPLVVRDLSRLGLRFVREERRDVPPALFFLVVRREWEVG
jgi:hypothetical protein